MALEVRTKDKVFLAVLIPILTAFLYWWIWRDDALKRLRSLQEEDLKLIEVDDFPMEYQKAQMRFDASKLKLENAKLLKPSQQLVSPSIDSTFAERETIVLDILRQSGLEILRISSSERDNSANANEFQLATNYKGQLRRYTLSGTYPSVMRALKKLSNHRVAVIPEEVGMTILGHSARWVIEVLL
ncbi:MAG: hypothetical protein J6S51_02760 [Kiritimatiellae bacterium]|nr:hypothetical protein [Kiritimatiellia bacterium]